MKTDVFREFNKIEKKELILYVTFTVQLYNIYFGAHGFKNSKQISNILHVNKKVI